MLLTVLRSENRDLLERLADRVHPGIPFLDADGRRIGSVLRAVRRGDNLWVEVECVPEDFGCRVAAWLTTDDGLNIHCDRKV